MIMDNPLRSGYFKILGDKLLYMDKLETAHDVDIRVYEDIKFLQGLLTAKRVTVYKVPDEEETKETTQP